MVARTRRPRKRGTFTLPRKVSAVPASVHGQTIITVKFIEITPASVVRWAGEAASKIFPKMLNHQRRFYDFTIVIHSQYTIYKCHISHATAHNLTYSRGTTGICTAGDDAPCVTCASGLLLSGPKGPLRLRRQFSMSCSVSMFLLFLFYFYLRSYVNAKREHRPAAAACPLLDLLLAVVAAEAAATCLAAVACCAGGGLLL